VINSREHFVIKVEGKSREVPQNYPRLTWLPFALAPDRYICGGAVLFAKWEDWNLLDGSYFCFISLSTIGFGDIVPGDKIYYGQGLELSFIFCSMYLMLGESPPRAFSAGYRSRMKSRVCRVGSLISKVDLRLGETCELLRRSKMRIARARLWRQTKRKRSVAFFRAFPFFPPRRKSDCRGISGAQRRDAKTIILKGINFKALNPATRLHSQRAAHRVRFNQSPIVRQIFLADIPASVPE